MAQSQERVVDSKAEHVEPDATVRRPRELSYRAAQAIALLITAGVLVVCTLIMALLTSLT
jgi:hypothetical protein